MPPSAVGFSNKWRIDLARKKLQRVDGDHVLYHYLQKDLRQSDVWLFQMLVARLVAELGIWFSPAVYRRMPTLVPFAVRDPSCRKRGADGVEAWGSPDRQGRFRDDNSLVKNLPKTLSIGSPRADFYSGRRLGPGFVAAHVWRFTSAQAGGEPVPAPRDPWTNSFVPNLVWLPRQVAKLTDREGSFTQLYLQALSLKIYRRLEVPAPLARHVERTWDSLPKPEGIPEQGLPSVETLNFFEPNPALISRRMAALADVVEALHKLEKGVALGERVVSTRYAAGLPTVSAAARRRLLDELSRYAMAVSESIALLNAAPTTTS